MSMDTQQQIPNAVCLCSWETVEVVENFAWARDCFLFHIAFNMSLLCNAFFFEGTAVQVRNYWIP